MSELHYDWDSGPAEIQQHSIAKHNVLKAYLAAYFPTLISSPKQEVFRVTMVDAFAGGGLFLHANTGQNVKGSPLIFLDAAREAEFTVNEGRARKVRFEVDHIFVDANRSACLHLDKVLREAGHGAGIGQSIQIRNARFQDEADQVIEFIRQKSPKNGRSIFALDQYGYAEVPTDLIRKIFANLASAEVILTFAVDSFLNYANSGSTTRSTLANIGIADAFDGVDIETVKGSDKQWRLFIQSRLYRSLVAKCGARHYTPFFIRNNEGHGDYWLIHLSQHPIARDVMADVHWKNHNRFIHYGGAGLDMFGYEPQADGKFTGQTALGFEFDGYAREASVEALRAQIPHRVYANESGISFGELFMSSCNDSPATASIYRSALELLVQDRTLEVVSREGVQRRSAMAIHVADQIMQPRQTTLFGLGSSK